MSRAKAVDMRRSIKTIQVAGSFPVDLDAAALALERARGILEVLTSAAQRGDFPDAPSGALVRALYAARSEVERADAAHFGE